MIYLIFLILPFANCNIYTRDIYYPDNIVIGNLKRREVIPLNVINNPHAFNGKLRSNGYTPVDLSYRRSKDIRDRRYELKEALRRAQIAENAEKLEKLQSELQWLILDPDEGIEQQSNIMYVEPQL